MGAVLQLLWLLRPRTVIPNVASIVCARRQHAFASSSGTGRRDLSSNSDEPHDDDDVSLEELRNAARLARIDLTVCSDTSDTGRSVRSTSREKKLLEQVRASLKSFSRVRSVDVGDAEPLYNMADFLRQYRQSAGIIDDNDNATCTPSMSTHEDEMPIEPIDNEELLSMSSSRIRDGQYLVPKSSSSK